MLAVEHPMRCGVFPDRATFPLSVYLTPSLVGSTPADSDIVRS
jgi:hypothetical protein